MSEHSEATSRLYQCPGKTVLSIEHPGRVLNLDKAIGTLGGPEAIKNMADDPASTSLELRFRPQDRFEHPVISSTTRTSNLLIKVMPGGRDHHNSASGAVDHQPIAMIKHSVRFRGMADFQWNTGQSKFLNRLDEAANTRDAKVMSSFTLARETGFDPNDLDLPPPPIFSNTVIPHSYNYRQNPAAKKIQTETGFKLVNRTRGIRQHLQTVIFEDAKVPSKPSAKLPEHPGPELLQLVKKLRTIFEQRPMWTRRGIVNTLNESKDLYAIKFALPYVAFMWKSGPWRDCYSIFGLDPRKDPNCAQYQAIYCTTKTSKPEWDNVTEAMQDPTHLFDGKTVYPKGRTFQFVDMVDPILIQIKESATKRPEPHPRDGWWRSSTMQAIRAIIRAKLASLGVGTVPSDIDFTSILEHANDPDDEKVDEAGQEEAEESTEEVEAEDDEIPAAFPSLDERVQTLMGSLLEPGEEFDKDQDAAGGDQSDFEEDIFGGDSD